MTKIRVCRHLRRRAPRQEVLIISPRSNRRGETTRQSGHSVVFLREHKVSLEAYAKNYAITLKEAHFRDDVIETMVHESVHATLAVKGIRRNIEADFSRRGYDLRGARNAAERRVDKSTQEVMEDIRELSRLSRRPK